MFALWWCYINKLYSLSHSPSFTYHAMTTLVMHCSSSHGHWIQCRHLWLNHITIPAHGNSRINLSGSLLLLFLLMCYLHWCQVLICLLTQQHGSLFLWAAGLQALYALKKSSFYNLSPTFSFWWCCVCRGYICISFSTCLFFGPQCILIPDVSMFNGVWNKCYFRMKWIQISSKVLSQSNNTIFSNGLYDKCKYRNSFIVLSCIVYARVLLNVNLTAPCWIIITGLQNLNYQKLSKHVKFICQQVSSKSYV